MTRTRWATAVLNAIGITEEQLPELLPPGTPLGRVTPEAAQTTGLPAGLPVICGLGDGQAAALGANVAAPDIAYLNLGTAVVSGTFATRYVSDPAFRTTCGGVPGTFLLETVLLGGAYTVSWFMERIAPDLAAGAHAKDVLDAAAAELPPGAEGLLLVPYWNTAMSPYWDGTASGVVVGWRGHHDRRHLYRAAATGRATARPSSGGGLTHEAPPDGEHLPLAPAQRRGHLAPPISELGIHAPAPSHA